MCTLPARTTLRIASRRTARVPPPFKHVRRSVTRIVEILSTVLFRERACAVTDPCIAPGLFCCRFEQIVSCLSRPLRRRAAPCPPLQTQAPMPVVVAPPPESSLLLRSPQVQHKCDRFTTGAWQTCQRQMQQNSAPHLVTKQDSSSSCSPIFRHASRTLQSEACHAHGGHSSGWRCFHSRRRRQQPVSPQCCSWSIKILFLFCAATICFVTS